MTASPHIGVRPDWLALAAEPALEPDLPIVDAHHHLWDRPGERYLFPELLSDLDSGHDIRATVFVQCRSMYRPSLPEPLQPVGEVEFANGVAAQAASGQYGRRHACAAIVGCADLLLGDRVEPVLDALVRAGGGRLRGIRNQTAWHADPAIVSNPVPPRPGLLVQESFQAGARRLAAHGLSLDVWAYHTQLDEVEALARACPGTAIVLDHCGGPLGVGPYAGRRDAVFADWSRSLKRLSQLPNMVLKLGGLAMRIGGFGYHERPRPPSSLDLMADWRPYIETCIEQFGAARCLFESNFPVDKGMVPYAVLWNAFKRITRDYSAAERRDLFGATAARVYRLTDADLGGPL